MGSSQYLLLMGIFHSLGHHDRRVVLLQKLLL